MHKIKDQNQNKKILTSQNHPLVHIFKGLIFRRFKLALSQMQLKNSNNILKKCRITELS